MRGQEGFLATHSLLEKRGFVVTERRPHTGDAFGSWLIVVDTTPRLRIVWEAKDEWTVIQGELLHQARPRGQSEWKDLWIGKRSEDVTPDEAVNALERLRDFAVEARASQD